MRERWQFCRSDCSSRPGAFLRTHDIHGQRKGKSTKLIAALLFFCRRAPICKRARIQYPEENYYESLVQNHGGSCNAYTEFEYTNYEFDVQSQHFAAVLDIFANCFYQPRFARSAVDREIKAIESEFRLACQVIRYVLTLYHAPHSSNTTFQSDSSRIQQCQCSTSTKGHILTKFSWGSLER